MTRRLLLTIPVVLIVSAIAFLILRAAPGDPILAAQGDTAGRIDPELYAELRRQMGLDQPLHVQYFIWLLGAMQFDFGISVWTHAPIVEEMASRAAVTVELALVAFALVVGLGIPIGMASAVLRNTAADYALRTFMMVGLAVPSFWLGLVILLIMVGGFRWFPPLTPVALFEDPLENLLQFIFPAIAVAYSPLAITARIVRTSMLEVLHEEYIRTARAKGVSERNVVLVHALRNGIGPVLATLGFIMASLLTGTIVVETVFNLPGLGRYVIDAIGRRDYPSVQAVMVLSALVVVLVNLGVDVLQTFLDRRLTIG